ncbi:hypothetical protein FKM82_016174 [Ascaphus truei]
MKATHYGTCSQDTQHAEIKAGTMVPWPVRCCDVTLLKQVRFLAMVHTPSVGMSRDVPVTSRSWFALFGKTTRVTGLSHQEISLNRFLAQCAPASAFRIDANTALRQPDWHGLRYHGLSLTEHSGIYSKATKDLECTCEASY